MATGDSETIKASSANCDPYAAPEAVQVGRPKSSRSPSDKIRLQPKSDRPNQDPPPDPYSAPEASPHVDTERPTTAIARPKSGHHTHDKTRHVSWNENDHVRLYQTTDAAHNTSGDKKTRIVTNESRRNAALTETSGDPLDLQVPENADACSASDNNNTKTEAQQQETAKETTDDTVKTDMNSDSAGVSNIGISANSNTNSSPSTNPDDAAVISADKKTHQKEKDEKKEQEKMTEVEGTTVDQTVEPEKKPDDKHDEKVLIEKEGKFIFVSKADLHAQHQEKENAIAEDVAKKITASKDPPAPLETPKRAQSARTRKPKPPSSTRPASAHPRRVQQKKKKVVQKGLYSSFTSDEAKSAYDAWLARKKKEAKQKFKKKDDEGIDDQQRRKYAEECYKGWLQRKKEEENRIHQERLEAKREAEEREKRRRRDEDQFSFWLQHKREEAMKAKEEARIRQQIMEEQRQELEERKRISQERVKEWARRKRAEEKEKERMYRQRRKQGHKQMRQIHRNLASTYDRASEDSWTPSKSARLRREARATQHRVTMSVSLKTI